MSLVRKIKIKKSLGLGEYTPEEQNIVDYYTEKLEGLIKYEHYDYSNPSGYLRVFYMNEKGKCILGLGDNFITLNNNLFFDIGYKNCIKSFEVFKYMIKMKKIIDYDNYIIFTGFQKSYMDKVEEEYKNRNNIVC